MKRLFIAIDVDERTRAQVERISAAVRIAVEPHAKASWVRADRMHLTLHFLGHVDGAIEDRARDALAHPLGVPAFALTFDRLGFFPERGSPRVVWLGIRDGLEPIGRIHEALADRLAIKPDGGGPYIPHLTLARFRDRVSRASLAGIGHLQASAGPSRIDRVTLYESRLSPAGSTYIPLAEALLRPSG